MTKEEKPFSAFMSGSMEEHSRLMKEYKDGWRVKPGTVTSAGTSGMAFLFLVLERPLPNPIDKIKT